MKSFVARVLNRGRDLLFMPGTQRLWRSRLGGRAHTLIYHRVAPREERAFLAQGGCPTISPEEFERDVGFLKEIGARFMTFADLREGQFPNSNEFGVLITFDDGFRDVYERGLNILADFGVKATIFQSTAMLAGGALINEHRVYRHAFGMDGAGQILELARRLLPGARPVESLPAAIDVLLHQVPAEKLEEALCGDRGFEVASEIYPEARQLRNAKMAGHEIGSHGHGHYHRDTIGDTVFEQDMLKSKQVLTDLLGTPPACYSYPFNARKDGDQARCSRNFAQIATVDAQPITPAYDPLAIPRFSWPGPARSAFRHKRWLLTGRI